ncbi:replication protein A 70 kDa DNA-binding subunit B, partial [Tanacetum coccineum]
TTFDVKALIASFAPLRLTVGSTLCWHAFCLLGLLAEDSSIPCILKDAGQETCPHLVKEMEINMTQLCDLDFMLDDALARVISIWMSHPKQRPNEMWRLDAVLQDQMGNRVQATVRNQDIKKFQPILDEGACYRISNFGVDENGGNIPLLDHRYKLSFFKNTALTRVGIFYSNPRGFRFEHFGAFTSRKSLRELCDVIGTIVSISDAIPFNYAGVDKIRRTVILEDFE